MKLILGAPEGREIALDELQNRIAQAARNLPEPFSEERFQFCVDLGRRLFRTAPRGSALQSLGFFLREAHLCEFRDHLLRLQSAGIVLSPRGIVFQIPPSNVPSMMAYSWLFSAITGNVTVIRVPSAASEDTTAILELFSGLAAHPVYDFFIRYDHDEQITAALSEMCDLRVIWGGDETVRRLRAFPISPSAKEITFPDRYSFAVISADRYLGLADSAKDALVRAIHNDVYLFDQAACSSPRLIVWIGSPETCAQVSSNLYCRLSDYAATRDRCELGAVVAKKAFVCAAILDQGVESQTYCSNELTVVRVGALDKVTRTHCGGGLLFEYFTQTLDPLEKFICRRDQTLSYFGLEASELARFVRKLGGRGIDRVVPIGQALSFSYLWDGYDLLQEFVRRTHIPGAVLGEPANAAA